MVLPSTYFIKRNCIPTELLDLRILALLRYSLNQSSLTKEKSSFLHTFSLVSWVRDSQGLAVVVMTEAKKAWSMIALAATPLQGDHSIQQQTCIFPFVTDVFEETLLVFLDILGPGLIPNWFWFPHGLSAHSDHILTFIPASTLHAYPAYV